MTTRIGAASILPPEDESSCCPVSRRHWVSPRGRQASRGPKGLFPGERRNSLLPSKASNSREPELKVRGSKVLFAGRLLSLVNCALTCSFCVALFLLGCVR